MRAPLRGLAGPVAIDCVVRRALKRAGFAPEFKGAHLLRHSRATNLLRGGASLTEIGQPMPHSAPTATQIYATVDVTRPRGAATPCPLVIRVRPLTSTATKRLPACSMQRGNWRP